MNKEYFMKIALSLARIAYLKGEVPVGAIVVRGNKIISYAHNMREQTNNPSSHAEFIAIDKACRSLNSWRLLDCDVYVTLEPCIMCAGIMQQSRINSCIYGTKDPKCGALGSLYNIHKDTRLNHNFEVIPNILQKECSQILKDFFKDKRSKL